MKHFKRIFSCLLCLMLILSMGFTAFAKRDADDDEEDYSVSDVYFDITDKQIFVGWTGGESKTAYTVQLYKSRDFTTKNKVGKPATVSHGAEILDVTEKILQRGSGTYYAVVTAKKKPKGGKAPSAYGSESILSEDISVIRKNRPAAERSPETLPSSNGAERGPNGGPGTADAFKKGSEKWVSLPDGKWLYMKADGTPMTGWYTVSGKWYFSGEDGVMLASAWIKSLTEEKVWYYVGTDGAMLTDSVTPDNYRVDSEGKYKE